MKRMSLILGLLAFSCIILQTGCQEAQNSVQTPANATVVEKKEPAPPIVRKETPPPVVRKETPPPVAPKTPTEAITPKPVAEKETTKPLDGKGPRMKFEQLIVDLGNIDPGSSNPADYKFKNTGDALLKIIKVTPDCGCTQLTLEKKEYEPGESGVMRFKYHAVSRPMPVTRRIVVTTNDPVEPVITLTIKARVIEKVTYEPKRLNLLLKGGDDELPKITLASLDGKPFKITSVRSSANAINAEFDPEVEAEKFFLKLNVDKDQLRKTGNGVIYFSLTHPAAKSISIPYSALTQFKVNPPTIIVFDAEPGKPMIRNNVTILNNYQEDFEIASVKSEAGITKVLKQEKIRYGHRFSLQITPPDVETGKRRFTDEVTIAVKDGDELKIRCQGFYKRTR